jgi:hypothetical protein
VLFELFRYSLVARAGIFHSMPSAIPAILLFEKYMNEKNDRVIPELEFCVGSPIEDDGNYFYAVKVFMNGERVLKGNLETEKEIFDGKEVVKKKRKKKGNERMMAYAMAYYVALRKNNSMSGEAALEAAEWLGVKDEKSIIKAANNNKYSLPKNAVVVAYDDPLGIVALLEPNKIVMNSGKYFYHGMVRSWKVGDKKVAEGVAALSGNACDTIVSPIKKLNDKKSKT